MPKVELLALKSRRLRLCLGVAAGLDDPSNTGAEGLFKLLLTCGGIFENIMQEACDGKLFVPTTFEHQPSDAKQVRHIGDLGSFAHLISMRSNREVQSIGEAASNHEKPRQLFTELLFTPRLCCCIRVSLSLRRAAVCKASREAEMSPGAVLCRRLGSAARSQNV